jgi:hypothetical protein
MAKGDGLESYGICDECKKPIGRREEVTYLFDKPVHTKCYPNEAEIQGRLNSRAFGVSLRPGAEASPSRHP